MLNKLKLKHLDKLTGPRIDYVGLLVDIEGYKNTWFNRKFVLTKQFTKLFNDMKEVKQIEPKDIVWKEDCEIKKPDNVDNISFAAMMTLQAYLGGTDEMSTGDMMAEIISITCFSENNEEDFDSESIAYKDFKSLVKESNAVSMIGLYNWLDKAIIESGKYWQKRFFEVEVDDKDYEQAGGQRMGEFNIVNSIKAICNDFGYNEKQAWQVPFILVQQNSLGKATQGHIQHVMSKIKEDRMKANQKKINI